MITETAPITAPDLEAAFALAAEIRELEGFKDKAPAEIDKLAAEAEARRAEVLVPVAEQARQLQDEFSRQALRWASIQADLEERRASIYGPYQAELDAIDADLRQCGMELAAATANNAKKAKELREQLGAMLGQAWEVDGLQSRTGDEIDLQITVKKSVAVADEKAAVATILKLAPGGKIDKYLAPNEAALDLVAGLVELNKVAPAQPGKLTPQAVRDELTAEYAGFTLALTFGPRLITKKVAEIEPAEAQPA